AGILVAHGFMSGQDTETFIGFAVFVLGLAWSWIEKRRAASPGGSNDSTPLILPCLVVVCLMCLTGCARFDSTQVKVTSEGVRTESHCCITTFLASKASVSKLRASVTATSQGVSVGSIDTEANVSDLVAAAVKAAVEGATK